MKFSHASAVAALAVGAIASCSANEANSAAGPSEMASKPESSRQTSPKQPIGTVDKTQLANTAPASAPAFKCGQQEVLFHCKTTNNKQISLCDNGDTLGYSFGNENETPDLALSVPREQATTFQWRGIGRWINYSITIPNGDTKYTVFTGFDRISDEHEFEAGVIVTVGGEEVARIPCAEPIEHNLEGVDLKQEE